MALDAAVATIMTFMSVQEDAILLNVIDDAALPKVVVAIGSYVAGIYAPLIPYSEKTEEVIKLPEVVIVIELIAAVFIHKPDDKAT